LQSKFNELEIQKSKLELQIAEQIQLLH